MAEKSDLMMPPRTVSEPRRYFKVQMRAWTSVDPSRMELRDIAEEIDRGTGFLTAIEILKVAEDVTAVDDEEVRHSFENVIAAERILKNVGDLPKAVRDRLSAALANENGDGNRKAAA